MAVSTFQKRTHKPHLTILIVNFNTSAFVEASLEAIEALTMSPYEVWIVDNGSKKKDAKRLRQIVQNKSHVKTQWNQTTLRGSIAHGTALSELAKNVETPYFAVLDADAAWLRKGWDQDAIACLTGRVKALGPRPFGDRPKNFPGVFALMLETRAYKETGVDFRPTGPRDDQDTGIKLCEQYPLAGYTGRLYDERETEHDQQSPFYGIRAHAFFLDESETGVPIASHFGRGSSLGRHKYKQGWQRWFYRIPVLGWSALWLRGTLEKRAWIRTVKKIVQAQVATGAKGKKKNMKKTRVTFIALGAYPLFDPSIKETFGGAEVQLYLLGTRLAAQHPEYEVSFIVADVGQPDLQRFGAVTVYKGMRKRGTTNASRDPLGALRVAHLLHKLKPQIVVRRTASAGTGPLCAVVQLLRGKFVFMAAHEIDCDGGYERKAGVLAGALYRYAVRHADLVIAQSEEQRLLLQTHHKKASIVLGSGYPIPTEDEVFQTQNERKHILWVGRLEDWKRPEKFIELARAFPEETFIMVAPRSRSQPAFFEAITKEVKTVPNLQHLPYVPFHQMDDLFLTSKLFVQTSVHEGFPNTFVQAMKNGTPILSMSVDPDGVLKKADCGRAVGEETQALQEACAALLKSPQEQERLGRNGWAYARGHYDINTLADIYASIFSRLVGETEDVETRGEE